MGWSRPSLIVVSIFSTVRHKEFSKVASCFSGFVKSSQITVTAPSNTHLPTYSNLGCATTNNNNDVLPCGKHESQIVFLCVKPNILKNSLNEGKPFIKWSSGSLIVVSILAGIRVADLVKAVDGPNKTVYRIMTNTACALGAANCAISKDENSSNATTDELILKLTATFGSSEFMAEYLMDAFSGVAGSGIAFVSVFQLTFKN